MLTPSSYVWPDLLSSFMMFSSKVVYDMVFKRVTQVELHVAWLAYKLLGDPVLFYTKSDQTRFSNVGFNKYLTPVNSK